MTINENNSSKKIKKFRIKNKENSHGNFFNIIDEFNYLPKDFVIDYFVSRAKTYVEKILPFEH